MRILVYIFAICLVSQAVGQERPYTVDDLLQLEELGQVKFDEKRARFLFEYRTKRDDAEFYSSSAPVRGGDRSVIYTASFDEDSTVEPAFNQVEGTAYWLSEAPIRGDYTLIHARSAGNYTLNILDLKNGTLIPVDAKPVPGSRTRPIWISDTEFITNALKDPGTGRIVSTLSAAEDFGRYRIARQELAWTGKKSTSDSIGSGRYLDDIARQNLVRVSITGETNSIGDGTEFLSMELSSNNRFLSVQRIRYDYGLWPNNSRPVGNPFVHNWNQQVVVYDLQTNSEIATLCSRCGPGFVNPVWSPSGNKLLFQSSGPRSESGFVGEEEKRGFSVYDADTGVIRNLQLQDEAEALEAKWFGERVIIRRRLSREPGEANSNSTVSSWIDWVFENGSVLTSELPEGGNFITSSDDEAYFLAKGDVWRVWEFGGKKTNLKPAGIASLTFLRSRSSSHNSHTTFALEGIDNSNSSSIVVFDKTNRRPPEVIELGMKEANVLGLSNDGKWIVFSYDDGPVTHYAIVAAGEEIHVFLTLNDHLSDVAPVDLVEIEYRNEAEEDLLSWLMLPANYRDGMKFPVVVIVYPGRVWNAERVPMALTVDHPHNPSILTGQGYGVLFVSTPLSNIGFNLPSDPLLGLADVVEAAVNRTIELGYADHDEFVLFGHSFGGYGALGIASQTDRFQALAALSGPSNLISNYGEFRVRSRGTLSNILTQFHMPRWAEVGQGRMSVPPWLATDRYIRNSPLFSVQSINTPVMIMHGDLDSAVPVSQSEEMFTALTRENKDAVFVRYWGEPHVFQSPANIRDMWRRIISWYDEHLDIKRDANGGMKRSKDTHTP